MQFSLRKSIPLKMALRLLGLMVSAVLVVRLSRLYMREFQAKPCASWCTESGSDTVLLAIPILSGTGGPYGHCPDGHYRRKSVRLGRNYEGRSVRSIWSRDLQWCHINYLELLAVFLTLKRFLLFLSGHYVLVRTENSTTVDNINRKILRM